MCFSLYSVVISLHEITTFFCGKHDIYSKCVSDRTLLSFLCTKGIFCCADKYFHFSQAWYLSEMCEMCFSLHSDIISLHEAWYLLKKCEMCLWSYSVIISLHKEYILCAEKRWHLSARSMILIQNVFLIVLSAQRVYSSFRLWAEKAGSSHSCSILHLRRT